MSETEQTTEAETSADERSRKSLAAAITILRHKLGPALAGEEGAEEALTPEAQVEMAGFVEWSDEDLQHVRGLASYIARSARPGCFLGCAGRGYTKDGALCQCVVEHHLREQKKVPGRQKERTVDEKRVAEAEESLRRAKENLAEACAFLDSKIEHCESFMAEYLAARGKLVEEQKVADAQAVTYREEFERATAANEAQEESAEAAAEECGRTVQEQLEMRGPPDPAKVAARVDARRGLWLIAKRCLATTLEALDAADAWRTNAKTFSDLHAEALSRANLLATQTHALDEDNAGAVVELDRLKKERARVAGHHQPKVDKAERRLRRLTYLVGGAS